MDRSQLCSIQHHHAGGEESLMLLQTSMLVQEKGTKPTAWIS